ncbi:MAG: aldose 1-epimerase family protein [Selenomonadaceae bacterium]|nr:aldose 1-epimerase family protein [Selenomonadaceae bacterium]
MRHSLENDILTITVDDHGAELKSITAKRDGTEYLWNGDPAWWKYSSPVLFPIVGKLVKGKYRYNGHEYELPGHGFGRISDFTCVRQSNDEIAFLLESNDETLKSYPFPFRLEISYVLRQNEVNVHWKVTNPDTSDMYFSIGAHPALRCPIDKDDDFKDCFLRFNISENSQRIMLNADGPLSHKRVDILNGTELSLDYELFKEDALVFDDLKSDEVSICSRKSGKSVTLKAKDFPFWGIWTKPGAPFLCIEPWHGHADYEDFAGDLSEKDGIRKLRGGESFDAEYSFLVNNGT